MSNTTLRGIRGAMAEGLVGHFGSGRGHPRPLSETELRDYLNRLHIDAGSVGASGLGVNFNITTFLDKIGSVQGDILYRDADAWAVLDPGTDGQVLTTHGSAANPTWEDAASPTPPLTHNHIFVGDASNTAADVAMSGDATIADTGAVTVVGTHLADGSAAAPSGSIHATDTGFYYEPSAPDGITYRVSAAVSGAFSFGLNSANALFAKTGGGFSLAIRGEGVSGLNTFGYGSANTVRLTCSTARGTISSPSAALQSDNTRFIFQGYGNTGFKEFARVQQTIIEPTPSDTAMGGRLSFLVSPLGSTTVAEKLRVEAAKQNILGPAVVGSISATPDASAILDLQSTTQGFLPPRMTTTQRNAISSPAEGLEVHDTTVKAHFIYQNGAWAQVTTGGSIPTGANPTATASDVAVNGSASTFMRSDAAPAVQKCSSSQFGLCKPDGATITASGGILSAAASGIGNTIPHPGYLSGRPYTMPITGVTNKIVANSTLYTHPFFVATGVTFTKARLRVVGGGSAGTKIRFGIYSNDAVNCCPGALLLDFGEVAGDSSGDKDSSAISLSLTPGNLYWCVIGANITGGTCTVEGAGGGQSSLMNHWLGSPSTNTTAIGYQATWTYGALPDPYPDTTPDAVSTAVPLVFLVP